MLWAIYAYALSQPRIKHKRAYLHKQVKNNHPFTFTKFLIISEWWQKATSDQQAQLMAYLRGDLVTAPAMDESALDAAAQIMAAHGTLYIEKPSISGISLQPQPQKQTQTRPQEKPRGQW